MNWKYYFNQPFLCDTNVQLQVCRNVRFPMLRKQFWNIIFKFRCKLKSRGNNTLRIKFPESGNFSRSEMLIMPISDLPKFLLSEVYPKFHLEFIVSTWLKFMPKNDISELFSKQWKSHVSAHLKLHIYVAQKWFIKMMFLTHFSDWLKTSISITFSG